MKFACVDLVLSTIVLNLKFYLLFVRSYLCLKKNIKSMNYSFNYIIINSFAFLTLNKMVIFEVSMMGAMNLALQLYVKCIII